MAEKEVQQGERIDYWFKHIKEQFDKAKDLDKGFSIDEFLKRDPVTKSLGDKGVETLREQLINAGVENLAGLIPVASPDVVAAAGGEKKERRKGLTFKEYRFGKNRNGDPVIKEVKEEEDGEEKEFFTDVYFPQDLDIKSDEADEFLAKMADMREGVEKGIQIGLNREKDGVIIKYTKGKEKFEEAEDLPGKVDVDDRKDWGRWRNRKIREIRDRIFSEVVFGIKPNEPAVAAAKKDTGKEAKPVAVKKSIEPMTQKGKEIAARIKALEGEEEELGLEEKEEEAKARIAGKKGKKGKEAAEKAEKERKVKEEEERKKIEAFEKFEQALVSGDRSKMDEAFGVAEKTVGGVDREKLANAGVRELSNFILAGEGARAKSVIDFFKKHHLSLFADAAIDMEEFRRRLEAERDDAMAKKAEQRAVTIEKAAREIGMELAPPKIMRQAEVERRVRELREKLRHGGVEAKFGKEISPEKIKEIFGREAREGILGVMMANLIKEQEGLSMANTKEEARENVVIDRMLKVFKGAFSDNFTREQCEEMYFAAKSWMLDRAAREKPQGFFARLFRPATKTGKIVKAGAYLATGVGSTLLTGPLGILITGALRQIDVAGNGVLDEKTANKFRREQGGQLRTNSSTGKLEQTGGSPKFMDELETNLANILSAEARRAIDQARPTDGMDLDERTQYSFKEILARPEIADDKNLNKEAKMGIAQRLVVQYYFKEILARPEIAGDQNLNKEAKMGIAQRLAVQYAIDDETEYRRQAARGVPDSFWEKVRRKVAHYDPRVGRRTPASERFNTGMAATGIGLGLALVSRADPTGWGRRLLAAYGGWKAGGALYEARYREQKDPMLNLEYRLQEADAQLKALKQSAEAGNWAMRDTREGQLREKLAEAKAVVETFPQDIKFRVRLQEAERRLEELRMELILVEFCKEQDEHAYASETLIERKLATAQAVAGGTTAFDRPRADAVAREKSALTWKGYGARIAGAAAGVLLAEGAHKAMELWQDWRAEQDEASLREIQARVRELAAAKAEEVAGAAAAGEAAREAFRTPEELVADFKNAHGVLEKQGFDVEYRDGKFIVEADIGKGGDFRYLDQALRRVTMQEYGFGDKTTFHSRDAGQVENSLANLRELIFGHKTGGMIPAEVKDFVHFDAKTGELRIDDYDRLAKYYDDRLFLHAGEVTNAQSGSMAYTNNTGRPVWQEMLDQKTGDPGHITAENFNRDPLVIAAEHRVFLAQANELGLSGGNWDITDEDTGKYIFTSGEYSGFRVNIDDGIVQTINVPAGMEDVARKISSFHPGDDIRLGSPNAGVLLERSMDNWMAKDAREAWNAEVATGAGETMEEGFDRTVFGPLKAELPKGWKFGELSIHEHSTGDITIFDPENHSHTAKFDNGLLQQVDQYDLTPKERVKAFLHKEYLFDLLKTPRKFDDLLRSEAAGGLVGKDNMVHIGEIEFSKGNFQKLEKVTVGSFLEGVTSSGDIRGERIEPIDPEGSLARAMSALSLNRDKTVGEVLVDYIIAVKERLSGAS